MIHPFKEAFEDRYAILRKEKEQGKKIVGWVCTYVPEEIFHAAGLYPVRIFGGKGDTTRADAYLYSNICSFARSCLEEGFQEYGKLLDGFVAVNSCDHIRRLYDIWKGYLPAPFTHILSLPHKVSESAIAFFTKQLLRLKEGLEEAFSLKISEENLRESISLHNASRELLKELYGLRKSPAPPISGSEVMEVILAGMVLPKGKHSVNPLVRWCNSTLTWTTQIERFSWTLPKKRAKRRACLLIRKNKHKLLSFYRGEKRSLWQGTTYRPGVWINLLGSIPSLARTSHPVFFSLAPVVPFVSK